ncbi:hypothetical protein PO124_13235 [Bacillus licheniformis]|nr:hypothetical protein [Bacillus licheniformis]
MLIWLFIVFRGIKSGLKREPDKGGLIHLLFILRSPFRCFTVLPFL